MPLNKFFKIHLLLQYKKNIFAIFLTIFLSRIFVSVLPFIYGNIIDKLTNKDPETVEVVVLCILGYGVTYFLSFLFNYGQIALLAPVTQKIIRGVLLKVFNHIHKLSHIYHLSENSGKILESIHLGLKGIETVIRSTLLGFCPLVIQLIFIGIIVSKSINIYFSLFLLFSCFFYLLSVFFITKSRLKNIRNLNNSKKRIKEIFSESLIHFETIKIFNQLNSQIKKLICRTKNEEILFIKLTNSLFFLRSFQKGILSLTIFILFLYSSYECLGHRMSIGQLVMLMTYFMQLFQPLEIFALEQDQFRKSLVDIESLSDILNTEPDVKNSKNAFPLQIKSGNIIFESVSFGYEQDKLTLKNITLSFKSKQVTCIVGETGSGKSSLAKIMLRFYDTKNGCIKIDNQNIRHITQESLREAINFVPQDIVLFDDSIFYNIAIANEKASPQRVYEAAKLAYAHDFIKDFPDSYNTLVGQRGLKLSGGERQRIALARSFLKGGKIFIFDEATSFLDPITERKVKMNIFALSSNATVIMIEHQLSSIKDSDQIIVMKKGKVVQQGKHKELLKEGTYKSLWNSYN